MTPAELIAAREALGLTQSALARRLGLSVNAVWRWEHAQRPAPPWLPLAFRGIRAEQSA